MRRLAKAVEVRRLRSARGFTMLEVMIALAILGFGLVVLIRSTGTSIMVAKESQMMGLVTDLSRAKMYDIEEILMKDGFSDSDQSEDSKSFDDEGHPEISYSYKVEQVELPSFEQLNAIGKGGKGASSGGSGAVGSARGSGAFTDEQLGAFGNSMFGGMMQSLGGLGGASGGGQKNIDGAMGASFMQGQYQMIQETLKVSIRKVALTVTYDVLGRPRTLATVAYFTDASAMDKVLSGLGSQELPSSSGSGSGSGSGTPGTGSTITPPRGGFGPKGGSPK